jgi:hypothetical protein
VPNVSLSFAKTGKIMKQVWRGLPRNCRARDRTPKLPEDWEDRERVLQSLPRKCRARDRTPMPRLHSDQSADPFALPRCSPPYEGDFRGV